MLNSTIIRIGRCPNEPGRLSAYASMVDPARLIRVPKRVMTMLTTSARCTTPPLKIDR
jgi:hypothetical protein